jgi:hypothetical protein
MAQTQRMREVISGPLSAEQLERRQAEGWRLVAVEWERSPSAVGVHPPLMEVAYGLRVAADHQHLEENPVEVQVMLDILEGIVQDQPMSRIAENLNRRGRVMRTGEPWTQSAVFELLPRLIDFGPRLFSRDEWTERRRKLHVAGG